jgi:Ca2+-binding RTX toxin-like protein
LAKLVYTEDYASHDALFEEFGGMTFASSSNTDIIYGGPQEMRVAARGRNIDENLTGGTVDTIVFTDEAGNRVASIKDFRLDLAEHSQLFWGHPANIYGIVGAAMAGRDTVIGSTKGEALYGYDGADVLKGGNGRDDLHGGLGRDKLTGGKGADQFFFEPGGGRDVIRDFDARGGPGRQDFIVLQDGVDISIHKQGHDTLIRYGNGAEILLEDVARSDVRLSADFEIL